MPGDKKISGKCCAWCHSLGNRWKADRMKAHKQECKDLDTWVDRALAHMDRERPKGSIKLRIPDDLDALLDSWSIMSAATIGVTPRQEYELKRLGIPWAEYRGITALCAYDKIKELNDE